MSNKQLLVIYYETAGRCFLLEVIKTIGYEMVEECLNSYDRKIIEAQTFSDLEKAHPNLLQHKLVNFDIIVILVCGSIGESNNLIIPKGIVNELKVKIQQAETKKLKPIRLVGISNFLPDEHLATQKDLFDGLFVGSDWDPETFQKFLEG